MPAPITITERVLAEWVDENTGQPCSLGSCSLANRQAPSFTFRARVDAEAQRLRLLFSLFVTVKAAGKTLRRELFFVIPPTALSTDHPPLTFESLAASLLNTTSLLDASVLQDANITTADQVIRVRFNLASTGYVVMPRTTSNTIKPSTSTSYDLLLGLKSLSKASRFTVYMKPSDYALVGLKALYGLLQNNSHDAWDDVNLAGMYDNGRDAVLLDWDRIKSKGKQEVDVPPPYDLVQVAQSPAPCSDAAPSPQGREKSKMPCIRETPCSTDCPPSSQISVRHGIFSNPDLDNGRFALLNADSPMPPSDLFDSDDERFALLCAGCPETPCDANSDEERYAHESSLALKQDAAGGSSGAESLFSDLVEWVRGARIINSNVQKDPSLATKLDTLGQHARSGNTVAFDASRIWCSTLVFYGAAGEASCGAARTVVLDMADQVRWANGKRRLCEMRVPIVRDEFVRLGNTARAFAVSKTGTFADYERQKGVCIARVLFLFGNAKLGL